MNFDLTSDVHIDFPIRISNPAPKQRRMLVKLVEHLIPESPSDTLVIAGDISNYNTQTIMLLEELSNAYKEIVVVLGNHDYWVFDRYGNSDFRVNSLIENVNKMNNVHLLHTKQNTFTDAQGIRFIGSSAFYDYHLAESMHGLCHEATHKIWLKEMNDAKYWKGFDKVSHIERSHKARLEIYESLSVDPHVIVTHVAPTNWHMKYGNRRETPSDTFYCFNGEYMLSRLPENTIWCFGHTHDLVDLVMPHGVKLIANPLGYIENPSWYSMKDPIPASRKFKTIEVNV